MTKDLEECFSRAAQETEALLASMQATEGNDLGDFLAQAVRDVEAILAGPLSESNF